MTDPIWILTTPRTGSTLLAGYLTDALGLEPELTERYITNPGYAGLRVPAGTVPAFNKVFPHQYRAFWGDLDLSRVEREHPGVRWVYLFRRDRRAQAESYARAMTSGVWNVKPDDPPAPACDPPEFEAMLALADLWSEESLWWERLRDRPHASVCYEELAADPAGTLRRLLGWLGRPDMDAASLVPRTAKLRRV